MKPNDQLQVTTYGGRPVFVAKADMQVSDLQSGGALAVAQARKFIQVAIAGSRVSKECYVTTMTSPQQEISKITTLGGVMHPGVEGQDLPLNERSAPGFGKVLLTSKVGKGQVKYPREVLEEQIEGNSFGSTLGSYAGQHVQADVEDLLIKGDTVSGSTAWLKMLSGMLALATTNVVDGQNAALSKDLLKLINEALPEEYSEQANLRYYTVRKTRSDYRGTLSDRQTPLGDLVISGGAKVEIGYDDIPLYKVPRWPNNQGGGSNRTTVWLGDPRNLVLAFHRKITMEPEWRPGPQVYVLHINLRIAINYEHEPMVAKATSVVAK